MEVDLVHKVQHEVLNPILFVTCRLPEPAHHVHPDKETDIHPKQYSLAKDLFINLSSFLEDAVQQPGVQVGICTATPNSQRYRAPGDGGGLIYPTAGVW